MRPLFVSTTSQPLGSSLEQLLPWMHEDGVSGGHGLVVVLALVLAHVAHVEDGVGLLADGGLRRPRPTRGRP